MGLWAVIASVGLLAAACDVHTPTGSGSLTTITVTPDVTLQIGQTQQFTAVATDQDGNVVNFAPEWAVVAGGGAISDSGMFTAGAVMGVFTATVEASNGTTSGTATVTVIAGPLATIEVTPDPSTLRVDQTQQFTAVGRDADGNAVPITPTWAVVNGGGTIDSGSGLFTAGEGTGTFHNTVEATSGGISGSATVEVVVGPLATIEVTPNPATVGAGQTQQFTAVGRDADGNVVPITPTWAIVNGGGTISSGSGLFTAGLVTGTFNNTVEATSGGISGTATIEVFVGPLATIEVMPDPATLDVGETQQFTAVGRDADGNEVAITPTWAVTQGGGEIDSGSGLFTSGQAAGTFHNSVEATSGGISGTATVEVLAGNLASIEVTPNPTTVGIGQTRQFTAMGWDADGNEVEISPVWSVENGGGEIDSGSGLFTAGTVTDTFTNTVEATSDGMTGSATVEVVAGPLASIEVTPHPATVEVDQTQQFTAVGKDAEGNEVEINPTWSVENEGGTINSGSGLFTAGQVTGTFNNTVEASSDGMTGSATVEVVGGQPPASPLSSAGDFAILAGAGIDCATSGSITGASTAADIGSSPTPTINGFGPCTFDGEIPETAVVETAKGDLTVAYLAAQAQVCDENLSGIDLGFYDSETPLPPGTYCFSTSVGLTGTLALEGSATDTWTFQIGSTLTAAVGSQVILSGGAIPDNVYWAVGSSATLNTNAAFQGNIMAQSSITLQADVSLLGRALAQDGAVALIDGGVSIVKP